MTTRTPQSTGQAPQQPDTANPQGLTQRETEVLIWVARGKSARQIGEILDLAKSTVDDHVHRAVRKIGATNRVHAVALALRDGIIEI